MPFSKESALDLLLKSKNSGRLAHACLLTGVNGSGKSWLASQLASSLLETSPDSLHAHPDAHFVLPESKSRRIVIDQIRNLEQALQRTPLLAPKKVAIISDADRLQPAAANAFLKTLEEPPPDTYIILTSALPEAILETILSRCIEIPLKGQNYTPDTNSNSLLQAIADTLAKPSPTTIADCFRLARHFQEILNNTRETITASHQQILKTQAAQLKNISGLEAWLLEREDQSKAIAEADTIRERDQLLNAILFAFHGALKTQYHQPPPHPASTALANKFSTSQLLAKLEHWETLRRRLALNTNETLAIETAFLSLFK